MGGKNGWRLAPFTSTPSRTASHIAIDPKPPDIVFLAIPRYIVRSGYSSGASLMRYRMSRPVASLALMCATASDAVAQDASAHSRVARLTGRVADAVGAAIVKAEILVTNTAFRAETGSDGRFELGSWAEKPAAVKFDPAVSGLDPERMGFAHGWSSIKP